MRTLVVLLASVLLSGCASIISGNKHTINVASEPSGAACNLTRQGEPLASIAVTPGQATIGRSAKDVTITCSQGAQSGVTVVESSVDPWVFGNLFFGGLIGLGIDLATGAASEYPRNASVMLRGPAAGPSPTPAPSPVAPATRPTS